MTEEKNQKFFRISNLVLISGITVSVVGVLAMFSEFDRRVKNLEETINQLTFSEEKVIQNGLAPGGASKESLSSKSFPLIGFQEDSWKEIANFNGKTSEKTEVFSIPSDWWKLSWRVDAPPEAEQGASPAFFQATLYKKGQNDPIKIFKPRSIDPAQKFEYGFSSEEYISGGGDFYFDVTAEGLREGWKIKIKFLSVEEK